MEIEYEFLDGVMTTQPTSPSQVLEATPARCHLIGTKFPDG